jgi:hypothetical protein
MAASKEKKTMKAKLLKLKSLFAGVVVEESDVVQVLNIKVMARYPGMEPFEVPDDCMEVVDVK